MNLSLKWLADYVDCGVSVKEFCAGMTMSGSKVETYETEGEVVKNVIVGKLVSITPHENSDHLQVCQVDVGGDSPIQIVTGAQNIVEGALVPVAMIGAELPGGVRIKKGKLRGVESNGMLCSLGELGLTKHDFPYAIEDGIFLIEEDCTVGQDIHEAIGLNDTSVEFEITSNRPDCLSVVGLAREAAVTFGKPLNLKAPEFHGSADKLSDSLSVSVENAALCPRYIAGMVKNVKIGPSPRWMRERLRASGVRPINNLVDITNYVMLEYGQPMHAFDQRYVKDGKIVVRNAKDGETITTLDGQERQLSPEMLIIADAEKPIAVAGVMGKQIGKLACAEKAAFIQNGNAVADFFHVGKNMAAEEDRCPELVALFKNDLLEFLAPVRVETEQRFVKNQKFRAVQNRLRDTDTLKHSARECSHFGFCVRRHSDDFQNFLNTLFPLRRRNLEKSCADIQKLHCRKLRRERRAVGKEADPVFHLDIIIRLAENGSRSPRGADQPHENFNCRGFACTVRPQKSEYRSFGNRDCQIFQRRLFGFPQPTAVIFCKIFGFDYKIVQCVLLPVSAFKRPVFLSAAVQFLPINSLVTFSSSVISSGVPIVILTKLHVLAAGKYLTSIFRRFKSRK